MGNLWKVKGGGSSGVVVGKMREDTQTDKIYRIYFFYIVYVCHFIISWNLSSFKKVQTVAPTWTSGNSIHVIRSVFTVHIVIEGTLSPKTQHLDRSLILFYM